LVSDQRKLWSQRLSHTKAFSEVETITPLVRLEMGKATAIYVAKAVALPKDYVTTLSQNVWAAGLQTWKKLAGRGIWVNGSDEGLGESLPDVAILSGREPSWLKLSHDKSRGRIRSLSTYRLQANPVTVDLREFTHFFWSSYSQFAFYLQHFPEITKCHHASGPGHTADLIEKTLAETNSGVCEVFIDEDSWKSYYLGHK